MILEMRLLERKFGFRGRGFLFRRGGRNCLGRGGVQRLFVPVELLFLGVLGAGCHRYETEPAPAVYWDEAPFEFFASVVRVGDPFSPGQFHEKSPFALLTADHVTDVPARFVADPFLWPAPEGGWFLFYEILDASTGRGVIGLSFSPDGEAWEYRGVVLEEPFHLSYPLVFEWGGNFYMLPEGHKNQAVSLYRAANFPYDWRRVAGLIDSSLVDCTIFRHDDRWWMLGSHTHNRTMRLYGSDRLESGWSEHPMSPVIEDDRERARLGGRVFQRNGRLYRVAQDCAPCYGYQVRVLEIVELSEFEYREIEIRQSPVLSPDILRWADWGTHHFDPHFLPGSQKWLVAIDGYGPAQPQTHLLLPFEDNSCLNGLSIRPAKVRAGDPVLLQFFWSSPPRENRVLYVHFKQGEKTFFQADHAPEGRSVYSITPHTPEDLVAGFYEIWVGLYTPKTGDMVAPRSRYRQHRTAVRLPVDLEVL